MSDESFLHCGLPVMIVQDDDPPNPRTDWEPFGHMVCFHSRYNLGDKHNYRVTDFGHWDDLKAAIKKQEHPAIILPLFLMDHGGLSIRTSSDTFRACDSAAWDWGQVGFVYVTQKEVMDNFGVQKITPTVLAKARKLLENEVAVYDQYLQNDVWGYRIRPDTDDEDTLYGIFGYDDCVEEAKRTAEWTAMRLVKPSIYMSV